MAKATVEQAKPALGVGAQGIQFQNIESMYRFAQAVAVSGWAPKGMERAESIVVAIQYGLEVGLTPMSALQNIAVINGRPSMFGDAQLALVRASGHCDHYSESLTDDAAHQVFIELQFAMLDGDESAVKELRKKLALASAKIKLTQDDAGFSVCTKRKGGQLEFDRFTVADAKEAKLWGKNDVWKQYPKRMLKFRARGFLLRDNYGDVLKGLLSFEEARDIELPVDVSTVPLPSLPVGRSSLKRPAPMDATTNGHREPEPQHEPEPIPLPDLESLRQSFASECNRTGLSDNPAEVVALLKSVGAKSQTSATAAQLSSALAKLAEMPVAGEIVGDGDAADGQPGDMADWSKPEAAGPYAR